MPVRSTKYDVTTSAGGAVTDTGPPINGALLGVRFIHPDTGAVDTGADFTITGVSTGRVFAKINNVGVFGADTDFDVNPREAIHDTGGQELSGNFTPYFLADERLRFAVAAGGNTKSVKMVVFHGW